MPDRMREAVQTGALLHDIGKFVQRAAEKPRSMDHEHWGGEWFQDNLAEKLAAMFAPDEREYVRRCISSHHEWVEHVTLADGISAGLDRIPRDSEEKGDPFTDRLKSVLSVVSLQGAKHQARYHKLQPLGSEGLREAFPVVSSKCTGGEYAELLKGFNAELAAVRPDDPALFANRLYHLLWKYTWCVPSAAYAHEPDISLFDHARTTAAVASCLHAYAADGGKADIATGAFIAVAGDISGIQQYIFDVLTQKGKTAKRLRARSFTLQALSEIAAATVVEEFGLPPTNVVYSAGGNFLILLPAVKGAEDALAGLRRRFDEWACGSAACELSISLAWLRCSGTDLIGFDALHLKLMQALQEMKDRPLHSVLHTGQSWDEGRFLLEKVVDSEESLCPSCRRSPIGGGGEGICAPCERDIRLGEEMTRARFLAFYRGAGQGFPLIGHSFRLLEDMEAPGDPYLLLALNDTSTAAPGFRFVATRIPSRVSPDDGGMAPLSFNEIAGLSRGGRLGCLKADVDNLGDIFRTGIAGGGMRATISRFSTLSRMLDTFFSGYLQQLLEKEYPEVYTVFSGGDDLLVIGPWDKILQLADRLRSEFADYAGGNPELTFSAGVSLARHHDPLPFTVARTEEAIEAAKAAPGKDSIAVFGRPITWPDLGRVLEQARRLIGWIGDGGQMSKAFAGSLGWCAARYEDYRRTKSVKSLRFIPELTYQINRNLSKPGQAEAREWAVSLIQNVDNPPPDSCLPILKPIMEYVLTYIRSGQ